MPGTFTGLPSSFRTISPSSKFFEFGFGQLNGVKALTKEYKNLELVNVVHDLQKLPRVAVLRRR